MITQVWNPSLPSTSMKLFTLHVSASVLRCRCTDQKYFEQSESSFLPHSVSDPSAASSMESLLRDSRTVTRIPLVNLRNDPSIYGKHTTWFSNRNKDSVGEPAEWSFRRFIYGKLPTWLLNRNKDSVGEPAAWSFRRFIYGKLTTWLSNRNKEPVGEPAEWSLRRFIYGKLTTWLSNRNKDSVGEPAEWSLTEITTLWWIC